jgi:CopG family nickel-responsive transcriptional regulator
MEDYHVGWVKTLRTLVLVDVKAFRLNASTFQQAIWMARIVRVGVTFPPELLKDLDEVIDKMGYESRSKAVQDAVRLFVSEKKWLREENADQTGILLMVYDHDVANLEGELTEVQHEHSSVISSSMHIHIGERDCLEAIAVKGKASEIRELSNELTTKKGVKILKTMMVSL